MSSVRHPQEKKRLSYERDHYNRNGKNNKSWRKAKPVKKQAARRSFRRAADALVRASPQGEAPVKRGHADLLFAA